MQRLLILLLLALPVWAQEADGVDPDSTDAAGEEVADPVDGAADDDVDDEFSDELYVEEDDDAFIPSENVKFGQSIPFPTDI